MTTPARRLQDTAREELPSTSAVISSHHVSASIALCAGAVKARSRAHRARSAPRAEALTAPVHRATINGVMAARVRAMYAGGGEGAGSPESPRIVQ